MASSKILHEQGKQSPGGLDTTVCEIDGGVSILNQLISQLELSLNVSGKKCESYLMWDTEKNPDFFKRIQIGESHFSVFTVEAFQTGAYIPSVAVPGQWGFDENKMYNMFEHITNLGALAYCYIRVEDLVHARFYMNRAFECVEQVARETLFPFDYISSFRYVLAHVCLLGSEVEKNLGRTFGPGESFAELQWFYHKVPSFEALSTKARAGVLGMKQYFWKMIKHDVDEAIELVREILKLDPNFYEWHYCLQACLRSKRRKHCYHHFQPNQIPSDEEKQAVILANDLFPGHPRCMLAEVLLIADFIKAKQGQTRSGPPNNSDKILYKNLDFGKTDLVVEFIRHQSREILLRSPNSVHINTTLAEVFTVLLPHQYRDFSFAQSCLERCLATHPWSSKANHRMGTFYLNANVPVDGMEDAEYFFHRAVTADPRNYPSLCALIQVMMRNVKKDSKRILALISDKLKQTYWDNVQRGGLMYFRGLIFFAVNRIGGAIDAFRNAAKVYPNSIAFEDLSYQHRRYRWPRNSGITAQRMLDELLKFSVKSKAHQEFQDLLIQKLEDAVSKENDYKLSLAKKAPEPARQPPSSDEPNWRQGIASRLPPRLRQAPLNTEESSWRQCTSRLPPRLRQAPLNTEEPNSGKSQGLSPNPQQQTRKEGNWRSSRRPLRTQQCNGEGRFEPQSETVKIRSVRGQ